MVMNTLVFVLGLAFIAGAHAESVTFTLCSETTCYEELIDCKRPNIPQEGNLEKIESPRDMNVPHCYCFCGKEVNANCTSSDECVQGSECIITHEHASTTVGRVEKGLCKSKCDRMSTGLAGSESCSGFERCLLNDGDAACKLRAYNCKRGVRGMSCEAQRLINNVLENEVFESPCALHETNRNIQELDPSASLWYPTS